MIVVDSSAVLAILLDEPEAPQIAGALAAATDPVISAATVLETTMAAVGRSGSTTLPRVDVILDGVRLIPFDATHADVAREAFLKYGKGQHPKAKLNFGDCISYALAKTLDRPLLFKGEDFTYTDLKPAT